MSYMQLVVLGTLLTSLFGFVLTYTQAYKPGPFGINEWLRTTFKADNDLSVDLRVDCKKRSPRYGYLWCTGIDCPYCIAPYACAIAVAIAAPLLCSLYGPAASAKLLEIAFLSWFGSVGLVYLSLIHFGF